MKITKRQLRQIIKEEKQKILREMIDPEYMREEIMSFAEETDAEGIDFLLDVIGGPHAIGCMCAIAHVDQGHIRQAFCHSVQYREPP